MPELAPVMSTVFPSRREALKTAEDMVDGKKGVPAGMPAAARRPGPRW